jgi:hypothetical protein
MDFDAIMARLAEATDAELTEALAAIRTEATKAKDEPVTTETVEKLEALAAAKSQIQAEQTRRVELADRAAAALGNFADEGDPEDVEPEGGTAPEDEDEDPEDDPEGEPEGDDNPEGEPVTAAGKRKLGSLTRQRGAANKTPRKPVSQVKATTRSHGDIPGLAAGTHLDVDTYAKAFAETFSSVRGIGGTGKHHVARVVFEYPEDRVLTADNWSVNTQRIEAVTSPEAITAAGGLCAPLENLYDIQNIGVTARPVRDALSRFGVDRGGIQFRAPFDALTMNTGLGVWTLEDDAAVGVVEDPDVPDPTKTCYVVECPGLETAVISSTYLCMEWPNIMGRFDREWVVATQRAADVAHARFMENRLLTSLLQGSKHLTAVKAVSAVRDVLVNLDKVVAYYRSKHRLDSMVPLRLILPRWVLDLFRADLTRGFAGDLDALAVADATILTWFRNRNVNITFHLDGRPADAAVTPNVPAQAYANVTANSAIPGFPDRIDAVLFAEGDWLYLDGGVLDLGIVRDSTLNAKNRYRTFAESFEGTAFRGIESLRLNMEVQPTGSTAATVTTSAFTD